MMPAESVLWLVLAGAVVLAVWAVFYERHR